MLKSLNIVLIACFLSMEAHALRYVQQQIVTAQSMGATITSQGVPLQQITNMALHAVYTGSPVGTIVIQVSNDNVPLSNSSDPAANVVNWTTYTGSSTAISAAGDILWNVLDVGYTWGRVVYTRTSGSGSLNVYYSGKGL